MKLSCVIVKHKGEVMCQSLKDIRKLDKTLRSDGPFKGKTRADRKLDQLDSLLSLVNEGREY